MNCAIPAAHTAMCAAVVDAALEVRPAPGARGTCMWSTAAESADLGDLVHLTTAARNYQALIVDAELDSPDTISISTTYYYYRYVGVWPSLIFGLEDLRETFFKWLSVRLYECSGACQLPPSDSINTKAAIMRRLVFRQLRRRLNS